MAADNMTHGINMNAIGRKSQSLSLDDETPCLTVNDLNLYYGEKHALKDINMMIPEKRVSAFIGAVVVESLPCYVVLTA